MDAVFALADRISVLVYGRVIASGTPSEIRANDEVKRAYLGDQHLVTRHG
jgi:branched-chain amino acid transport system ATP-binding protein